MKRPTCSRQWEAEALADGRLVGDERASFERHAANCAVCRHEMAELTALCKAMLRVPVRKSARFEHVARRSLLLRRANELVIGASYTRRPVRSWRLVGLALAAAAAFVLTIGWHRARPMGTSEAPSVPPRFEVTALGDAAWIDRSEGTLGRLTLDRGTVAVHVHRVNRGQRFLLGLPDGEIEVHGTRFTVEVVAGRTQRVEVTEGLVALRLQSEPEHRLGAGEHWTSRAPAAAAEPDAATTRSVEDSPTEGATNRSTTPAGATPMPRATYRPAMSTGERTGQKATAPLGAIASTAAARFAEAIDALDSGEFARAEGLFAEFARDFPMDPRTEDAMFLRAVARSKTGDRAGAASLAREYLRMFPHGLRQSEAVSLASF